VNGGTLKLSASDDFTQNSGANVTVGGGGRLNIDLGWGSNSSSNYTAQGGSLSVDGASSLATINAEERSTFNGGAITLSNGGTLEIAQGATRLTGGVDLNGGSAATAGTLLVHGNLELGQVDVANRPKITFETTTNASIASDSSTVRSVINLGTITKNGAGTLRVDATLNNIEASQVVINEGTLLLGASHQLANSNNMTLAGAASPPAAIARSSQP
jgi:hypothetical protein